MYRSLRWALRWAPQWTLPRSVVALLLLVTLVAATPGDLRAADPPADGTAAGNEIVEYPDFGLPVSVEVVGDSVSLDGRWTQAVKLTVTEGGTFGDVSLAVYGNINHYDEMFEAARKLDPSLAGPTLVRIGQEIALDIDPTQVFILKTVRRDSTGLTRQFASGVKDVIYERPTTSVARIVEFPAAPARAIFQYPMDGARIDVPSSGRIVDLRYRSGDDLAAIVRAALGETSYLAADEIIRQTGWKPTNWPPPAGEVKRVVLGPLESYRPPGLVAAGQSLDSLTARVAAEKLAADRARAGISTRGILPDGTVFRIAVGDPGATARDVSRLLFGDDREYLRVATAAGFTPPAGPPPDYNPVLFGTSSEITVPFAREWFPYSRETEPETGAEVIRLLNGTVVARYPAASARGHGLWESTRFPNGYRSFTYRPDTFLSTVATAVAYLRGVRDLGLDRADQENARARYAGEFIWDWAFELPREPGDIPDSLAVRQLGDESVMQAVIGPSAPLTPFEQLVDSAWNRSPLAKAAALFGLGVVLTLGIGLTVRRWER